jgi:hypothetical protein
LRPNENNGWWNLGGTNVKQYKVCLISRNAKDHDPFYIEGYIDRECVTQSIQCICNNDTRPSRNFTIDVFELLTIEHKIVKIDVNLSGIVNGN